jgi:hypothetical protein
MADAWRLAEEKQASEGREPNLRRQSNLCFT